MMDLQLAYSVLLIVSLGALLAQLLVRNKKTVHLVFAIFCGSMTMVAAKQLGSDSLGLYQYIIGLGTCFTCNGMWLVSRALFRSESAISKRHICIALVIAALVMLSQGIQFASALTSLQSIDFSPFKSTLGEVANLLSSCILMLTFWEAARGFGNSSGSDRWQRLVFMSSFGGAVFATSILATGLYDGPQLAAVFPWFVVFCALQMVVVTQVLISWRVKTTNNDAPNKVSPKSHEYIAEPVDAPLSCAQYEIDHVVLSGIERAVYEEKIFLQPNLKMVDLAHRLNVAEYKVSRIIRHHYKAKNFNQFINQRRVEYAKQLIELPANQHWPVLVIGLESGFASIGPFNRAFKSLCGCTPKEYRQSLAS